jgi:shikimate dehydrogenase
MINGNTKMMCLLGNPVEHSLSPALHNELCRLNKFDGLYAAFAPSKEELGHAVQGLKAIGCIGFNVTYPYKEDVITYLDELDEDAKTLNAVNTVLIQNNRLIGYNTDAYGFQQLLIRNNIDVKNKKACILGTGGASRAVALALKKQGVDRIDFYSRTKSENTLSYDEFEDNKTEYSIIINGTPLGMGHYKNILPIEPLNLNESTVVVDLIYNPNSTKLLTIASENGYNIVNGYDMLYYQGLKAYSIWTGINVDYYEDIKKMLITGSEEI